MTLTITDENALRFMAGFELSGWRQDDGTLVSSIFPDLTTNEWPREIRIGECIYHLNEVTRKDQGLEIARYD